MIHCTVENYPEEEEAKTCSIDGDSPTIAVAWEKHPLAFVRVSERDRRREYLSNEVNVPIDESSLGESEKRTIEADQKIFIYLNLFFFG